jgi:hypothetical protein
VRYLLSSGSRLPCNIAYSIEALRYLFCCRRLFLACRRHPINYNDCLCGTLDNFFECCNCFLSKFSVYPIQFFKPIAPIIASSRKMMEKEKINFCLISSSKTKCAYLTFKFISTYYRTESAIINRRCLKRLEPSYLKSETRT